ncbi:hypothetical protein A3F37_03725 [Candidatus Saccharibacteria bacterium RIFCSPHIGHO2_12_FULL_41_12]|nr:MAG: hypothetical protein A3F37_03725 [Candidatus Saccharibacteria bacterium RIFCSPHIGHO2_12_FULL_41_12]
MNFKIDKDLKVQAKKTASAIGIPLSTLLNAYLIDFVATGRVEFTASEQMTPQMERIIEECEQDIAEGNLSGPFHTKEELFEHLDSLK